MKTIKNRLFLATAILALASCADNTYIGDQDINTPGNGGAISFGSSTPSLTRSNGATAANELGYKFKVYGVKKVGSDYSNVFATGAYSTATDYNADPDAYWVWYESTTAGKSASNTADWEYVGVAGDHGTTDHKATVASGKDQTIKYWDYSADQYEFVAYSATVTDGTTPYSITNYKKDGFTITATAAELAGLYVADKKVVTSADYKKDVQFTFRSSGTKVRLGIYETINGYVVNNVKFRANNSEFEDVVSTAKLSGSFNGTSSSARGTYNVSYNATTGVAEFDNTAASANNYFEFGSLTYSATAEALGNGIGISSTAPTWAGGGSSPYYQGVLPNTDNVGNMILYVDYDLYNSKSGETIHVKGAKAVVPSMYMTWNPNYAYTYLFKISDNTNGYTGTEGSTPAGLYPITLDAVTVAATDGQQVGTITTVSTPAITTYQNGSVSDAGITYATATETQPIYITVNTAGTLATLTAENTKLYTVPTGTTEADLILGVKTKTSSNLLSILSTSETVQGITFANGTSAKFTPENNTTYAVEYLVSAAVAAEYTAVTTTDVTNIGTYYERSGDDPNFTYAKTTDTAIDSNKTYYTLTTPAVPAVYQYKIIVVGNPS